MLMAGEERYFLVLGGLLLLYSAGEDKEPLVEVELDAAVAEINADPLALDVVSEGKVLSPYLYHTTAPRATTRPL